MASGAPKVYSIAAHRGFADALVAGLMPRYASGDLGLSQLTLLLPSSRAVRAVTEAFVRHAGQAERAGLLLPRMATVGDLDLDESLGPLLDPIGLGAQIAPAVEPRRRLFELARLVAAYEHEVRPSDLGVLRIAREIAETIDRLLVEEVEPEALLSEDAIGVLENLAEHWKRSTHLFATVERQWRDWLERRGLIERARRRNLLFDHIARRWREDPPQGPVVAAGITSAAPALARLLKRIAMLDEGAVILPDLDLTLSDEAWDELGRAGRAKRSGERVFGRRDAFSHPQYHLKLLLNRMGINRREVRPWHRKGEGAGPPQRSHAISALFLPPKASAIWSSLDAQKRRLPKVAIAKAPNIEVEAQIVALAARRALEREEKRVAIITPDRALARRISAHLERWNIRVDDSAGRALSLTPAGRVLLGLAQLASGDWGPVELVATLSHPLVAAGEKRGRWLDCLRRFDRALRGPRPQLDGESLAKIAEKAGVERWWSEEASFVAAPLETAAPGEEGRAALAEALDELVARAERLCGEGLWAREDGRSLAAFLDDVRLNAKPAAFDIETRALGFCLRELMDEVAVRPPYGGHPRVAIYGLLESRMMRADLAICAGLNEGHWPAAPKIEPLLAPAVLRALGVPSAEFPIGLSAHDLASALGAREVLLTRAERDSDGPTVPSRFLSRIEALLGPEFERHEEKELPRIAEWLDRRRARTERYPRPQPSPSAELRRQDISATALDRLLGDPYQFYAAQILRLRRLDPLDADPDAAWKGTLVHRIMQRWHDARERDPKVSLLDAARAALDEEHFHPVMRALWQPRLFAALEWIEKEIARFEDRAVIGSEITGAVEFDGVRIHGRADRIDRFLSTQGLAIVDYKTGTPPSAKQVEQGFALQLGVLGLIAREGGFKGIEGEVEALEYWALTKKKDEFGWVSSPVKRGKNRAKLSVEDLLEKTEGYLTRAIEDFIKGDAPFTARLNPDYKGYTDYDQLMRLEEWFAQESENEGPGA